MSEHPEKYETEIDEAMQMLGVGHGDRDAEIYPPQKVKTLSTEGLVEIQVWGWVKTSASFIRHLRKLKGAKLSVWNCIALSIDEKGRSKLTLKQISLLTGYSHEEVINTVRELESMGYLGVNREGKGNIYSPEFVARGSNKPNHESTKLTHGVDSFESTPQEEKSDSSIKELKESINVNERLVILKKLFENNIQLVTPIMADELKKAAKEFTDSTWYEPAFKIALENNARNWKYIYAVLSNWKVNGRAWTPTAENGKKQGQISNKNNSVTENWLKKKGVLQNGN